MGGGGAAGSSNLHEWAGMEAFQEDTLWAREKRWGAVGGETLKPLPLLQLQTAMRNWPKFRLLGPLLKEGARAWLLGRRAIRCHFHRRWEHHSHCQGQAKRHNPVAEQEGPSQAQSPPAKDAQMECDVKEGSGEPVDHSGWTALGQMAHRAESLLPR